MILRGKNARVYERKPEVTEWSPRFVRVEGQFRTWTDLDRTERASRVYDEGWVIRGSHIVKVGRL